MFRERKQMTGQAKVNAAKLRELPIALPSIFGQNRILVHLESVKDMVERTRELQMVSRASLARLFPSFLDTIIKAEAKN